MTVASTRVNQLTALTTLADGDLIPVYDADGALLKYITKANHESQTVTDLTDDILSISKPSNTICLVGDSIVSHDNFTPDPGYSIQSARGIFAWTNYLLGNRFYPLNLQDDPGVSGETVAEILLRVPDILSTYSPEYLWLDGGINSIYDGASAATIKTNFTSIFDLCIASGARVIVLAIMPNGLATTTAHTAIWNDVNRWLREKAKRTPGIYVIDSDIAYIDTSQSTPTALSGYTVDATHQDVPGAYAIALKAYNILNSVIPSAPQSFVHCYDSSTADDSAAFPNPMMTTSTAVAGGDTGMSGVKPSGITAAITGGSTGVGSLVARTDAPGNWFQIAFTGDGSFTNIGTDYIQIQNASGIALATGGFSVGDKIQILCEFEMDASPTEFAGMQLDVQFSGASGEYAGNLVWSTSFTKLDRQVQGGVMATYPKAIPVGCTTLWVHVRVFPGGANSSFTFRIGRMAIRKISTL